MIGIVAIARNMAIGVNGGLPWHHSPDLKFFKHMTMGGILVMGTRTWRSIGKPLPGRLNIVMSRSGLPDMPPTIIQLSHVDQAVELAKFTDREVFVIGGAEIFKAFTDHIDKWIVTDVPDEAKDADTFFSPELFRGFETVETSDLGDGLKTRTLKRIS